MYVYSISKSKITTLVYVRVCFTQQTKVAIVHSQTVILYDLADP